MDGSCGVAPQGILTFRPGVSALVGDANPIFKLHLFLGMTIFLVFPFTRLVHVWSAPIWYLGRRGYQVVRTADPSRVQRQAPAPAGVRLVIQARRPLAGTHPAPAE